jgi:pyruvate formate lyase activating enzyme
MRVGGITDMSTIDWYGNVSLVLFLAGCNLKCPYCHNSGLIPLESGSEVSIRYLNERIDIGMNPVPQLDSVVVSGGEPLLQPDAVIAVSKLAKQYGLKVMLDTNGTIVDNLKKVLSTGLIDRVALDVKAPLNPLDYGRVSGIPEMGAKFSESVAKALKICYDLEVEVEVRTTVALGVSDEPWFIRRIAENIKCFCDVYYIQQFDNQGEILDVELKNKGVPSKEHLRFLAKEAVNMGLGFVYIKTRQDGLERVQ